MPLFFLHYIGSNIDGLFLVKRQRLCLIQERSRAGLEIKALTERVILEKNFMSMSLMAITMSKVMSGI